MFVQEICFLLKALKIYTSAQKTIHQPSSVICIVSLALFLIIFITSDFDARKAFSLLLVLEFMTIYKKYQTFLPIHT